MNNSFSMQKSPIYPQCSRQRSYKSFSSIRQKSKSQLKVSNYNSVQSEQSSEQEIQQHKKLDNEFVISLNQVELFLPEIQKHERIRIELWLKKLCEVTTNYIWKQNRNLYISVLLEMLKNNMLCEPFIHVPPEGPLPRLSKHDLILPWQKTQKSTPIKYNTSHGMERTGSTYSQLSVKNSHNKTIHYNNVNSLRTPIPKSKSKSISSQQKQKSNFQKNQQTLHTYQSENGNNCNFNFTTDENFILNKNNFDQNIKENQISNNKNDINQQQQRNTLQQINIDNILNQQIQFQNKQKPKNLQNGQENFKSLQQQLQNSDIMPFLQKINEIEIEKMQLMEINNKQKEKIKMLEQKLITQNTIAEQFQERLSQRENQLEINNQELQQQKELNNHFNELTNTFVQFIQKNISFILQNKKKLDTQLQYLQIMNEAENLGKLLNFNFMETNLQDKSIDNFTNQSMDKEVNNIFQDVQQRFDKANYETEKFQNFLEQFKDNISNLSHNNSMNCTNTSLIFNQTQNGNYFNKSHNQSKQIQNVNNNNNNNDRQKQTSSNINNSSVNTWQNESTNNNEINV